jgi:hypothetical protein
VGLANEDSFPGVLLAEVVEQMTGPGLVIGPENE